MRVIVTGSREWDDEGGMAFQLGMLPGGTTVVHGDARGADRLAAKVAEGLGFATEAWPADWKQFGKSAGGIRNQVMVNLGADLCIAFPTKDSVGTWDCVRRAKNAGIPVRIVRG